MSNIEIFNSFAAAFENVMKDDNWIRLEKYLAEDATYLNVGSSDPKCKGRDAIIAFLKLDASKTDRRFDTRNLIALTPPVTDGERLARQWCCTYTLSKTPDLVVNGEARYLFENGLIKEVEVEVTRESMQDVGEWMEKYGGRLHA